MCWFNMCWCIVRACVGMYYTCNQSEEKLRSLEEGSAEWLRTCLSTHLFTLYNLVRTFVHVQQ